MANWTSPRTWAVGEVLTASLLNTHLRDNLKAAWAVGDYKFICRAATAVETLINGAWLECNGVTVSRTTYSAYNTYVAALSPTYPFGNGNGSTTVHLPPANGRAMWSMDAGGHSTVNALGDSDGAADNARTPEVTISGTSGSAGSHNHGGATGGPSAVTDTSSGFPPTGGPDAGNDVHTHTISSVSDHSHSFSGTAAPAYLVGGVWAIKVFD